MLAKVLPKMKHAKPHAESVPKQPSRSRKHILFRIQWCVDVEGKSLWSHAYFELIAEGLKRDRSQRVMWNRKIL